MAKASGQSYYDYVRDHVYKPAGMTNTDAYVRDGSTPNMAIGYAGGGMCTAIDMLRSANALNEDTLIPKKYSSRFRGGGFAGRGPGANAELNLNVAGNHTIVVLSNSDPPTADRIGREIAGVFRSDNNGNAGPNRYRIGVGLKPSDEGVAVAYVVPDAPAECGGLKADDVIVALSGTRMSDDPIGQIDAVLTKPDPIELKVRRGDELKSVTITPELMNGEASRTETCGGAPSEHRSAAPSGAPT